MLLAVREGPIDGAIAAQWGLATVAVPKDALLATARRAAQEV